MSETSQEITDQELWDGINTMSEQQYTEEMFTQVRAKDIKVGQYLMRWIYSLQLLSVYRVHMIEQSQDGNRRPLIIFTYEVSDGIVTAGQETTHKNGKWSAFQLQEVDFTRTPPVATVVQWVPANDLLYVLKPEYEPAPPEQNLQSPPANV